MKKGDPRVALSANGSDQTVLTVVLVPWVFTDSMPASRPAAALYIWLVPITWWLAALRLKYQRPSDASLRS